MATKAEVARAAAAINKRLPQVVAAELIGKPAVWLRDNPDVGGRNPDGTWNAPQLVAGLRQRFVPAELPDSDFEGVLQATEELADSVVRPQTVARLLERIQSSHGAAGMAAFAIELLNQLQRLAAYHDGHHGFARPTPEQLRAELDRKLADLAEWDARDQGRVAVVCGGCDSYRWGRHWREGSPPTGYAITRDRGVLCPPCEKGQRKRSRKTTIF